MAGWEELAVCGWRPDLRDDIGTCREKAINQNF